MPLYLWVEGGMGISTGDTLSKALELNAWAMLSKLSMPVLQYLKSADSFLSSGWKLFSSLLLD